VRVVASLLTLGITAVVLGAQTVPPPGSKRVLVIYADQRLLPTNVVADSAIQATFAAESSFHIELLSEFLDVARFPGLAQSALDRDYLRQKYRARRPDLIIAGGGPVVRFLLRNRATLFSDVPILSAIALDTLDPAVRADTQIAGPKIIWPAGATMRLAFRLHPETRHVAVVSGATERDHGFLRSFRADTQSLPPGITFLWLTGLRMSDLRREIAQLPDHTIVMYLPVFGDASGTSYTPRQALDEFAAASPAPIYAEYDPMLGHGIVGGEMVEAAALGRTAALIARRILHGEAPAAAARGEPLRSVPTVDWRELRRWGIAESRLPPGTVVRFRSPSLWAEHRAAIIATIVALLLEGSLIVALLLERRSRNRARADLQKSEDRGWFAGHAARVGVWTWDVTPDRLSATPESREAAGLPVDESLGIAALYESIEPSDRAHVRLAIGSALETGRTLDIEYRVRTQDGGVRWITAWGQVDDSPDAPGVRLTVAALDVTARKKAELQVEQDRQEIARLGRAAAAGHLSASITHELNQPLAAILANAQAGQRLLAQQPPDISEVREILADIAGQDERAAGMIRRLRAHFERGDTRAEPIDLSEIARRMVAITRSEFVTRQVSVSLELPEALPLVSADRVQIEQVMLNLILNALDAMADAAPADRVLSIRVAAVEGIVRVSVADHGAGIHPEMRSRLFTPFATDKPGGMGMGLSISRSLVEAHGGRLTAENNADRGATFTFELPLPAAT